MVAVDRLPAASPKCFINEQLLVGNTTYRDSSMSCMASSQLPQHPTALARRALPRAAAQNVGILQRDLNSRGFNHLTALVSVLQLSVQGMWAQ